MFATRAAAAALLLLVAGSAGAGWLRPRIIGGTDAAPNAWPFAVALLDSSITGSDFNAHFCGGSLVAPSWVLTAGHCVEHSTPAQVQAIPGEWTLNATGTDTRTAVDAIIIHPGYDNVSLDNDLALLHLASPGVYTVATDDGALLGGMAIGDDVVAIGWGALTNTPETFPVTLQEVTLDYIPPVVCDGPSYYDGTGQLTASMFCAGVYDSTGPKDTCYGDSGGPLLRWTGSTWKQVGITSSGSPAGCAIATKPGIYTDVGRYAAWIAAVQQDADLAVSLATVPDSTTRHHTVLRVAVPNHSPVTTATAATLTLALAGPAAFGGAIPAGCTGDNPLTCDLGDAAPLATQYRDIEVDFSGATGQVTLTASVAAAGGDFNPDNDQAQRAWSVTRQGSDGGGALPGGALAALLLLALRRNRVRPRRIAPRRGAQCPASVSSTAIAAATPSPVRASNSRRAPGRAR